jgi:MFS family permease
MAAGAIIDPVFRRRGETVKLYQAFLWTMIASLVLAALLGIWALLMPGFSALQEKVLVTSLFVALYLLPAFGCAIVLNRRRDRPIMWIGVASAILALGAVLAIVWFELSTWTGTGEMLLQAIFTATILAVWAAHFGLIRLARLLHPWAAFVPLATVIGGTIIAASIVLVIWFESYFHWIPDNVAEWLARLLGAMGILVLCGTIITPTLVLIERLSAKGSRESLPSQLRMELVCPRCGSNEQINVGVGRCSTCGLRISIDIEEPRCTCGYLLHKLTGDQCPECGRIIPEIDRWNVARAADAASSPSN